MVDPLLNLAFSVHSNKGVYALLLGSGISRSSGIPTGWEITLDLARQLACLMGQGSECEPDAAAWYSKTFGTEPDYSDILKQLAPTREERSLLLRRYFEPTEDDREQGKKVPTAAHRAIARLVADGSIRLIVTTNFDRLMESALEELGTRPTVISTAEAAGSALPLIHTQHCVVKIHGDYLDPRIRNTADELATYPRPINKLLDRIFDEFGLIVCGWSGDWDAALRSALERCKSRRFSTYWMLKGSASDSAKRLVALRQAVPIPTDGADTFWPSLAEKVLSLQQAARPHPMSVTEAVASIKRYLPDNAHRIRLHDLVMGEAEHVWAQLSEGSFPASGPQVTAEELQVRLSRMEGITERLRALVAIGAYWGEADQSYLWTRAAERIAHPPGGILNGLVVWLGLKLYPALIVTYTAGIAAVAAKRYGNLAAVTTAPVFSDTYGTRPLILGVNTSSVDEKQAFRLLPSLERHHTPTSDHVHQAIRESLRDAIPDDAQYDEVFDRYEYLACLVCVDLSRQLGRIPWGPIGRFGWRHLRKYARTDNPVAAAFRDELSAQGDEWLPLKAGLFGGSSERALWAKNVVDGELAGLGW